MNRRELMLLLGGMMTAARGLRAQQKAMPGSATSALDRPAHTRRLWRPFAGD
jgi:hypothetical protein